MTGPTAHHELGASGAYRWIPCPGSVPAQRGKSDESSVYALEGTSAHELAECTLNFWKRESGATQATQDWSKAATAAGYDKSEMLREVDKYIDYVKDLCRDDPDALTVEMEVSLDPAIPGGFGTSDTVVVLRDSRALLERIDIGDLKYGKGKQVFADNNPQLKLYAYGTIKKLIAEGVVDEDLDDFDEILVGLHICQPRLDHFDSVDMTITELFEWVEATIVPAVTNINNGDETRVAGSHCDFCKAQATCREKAEQHARDLDTDFDDFIEDGPDMTKANELSADEIGKLLAHKKDVEKWFEALKAHAYAEIEAGRNVPGWKLVAGNNAQKWNVDNDALLDAFKGQRALKQDEYAPRKLLSPAAAVKLLPEKSTIRDLITKAPGKPVLADAKSKKPALVFKDMFDDAEDEDDDL